LSVEVSLPQIFVVKGVACSLVSFGSCSWRHPAGLPEELVVVPELVEDDEVDDDDDVLDVPPELLADVLLAAPAWFSLRRTSCGSAPEQPPRTTAQATSKARDKDRVMAEPPLPDASRPGPTYSWGRDEASVPS
jgi:hypothetical protein